MAEGYTELTSEQLKNSSGMATLNQMIRTLYDNTAGDTDTRRVFYGVGTPEGAVAAGIGSLYMRTDGGTGTSVYIKEAGTADTGWVGIAQLGTPVSLANGGTGASLSDPGADRIYFWDDSAGATDWLIPGTNLSITDKTLNASSTSMVSAGGTISAASTEYLGFSGENVGSGGGTIMPFACTISDLYVRRANTTNELEITLMINAVADTTLQAAMTNGNGTGNDLVGSISLSAGDKVSFRFENKAGTSETVATASVKVLS